MTHTNIIIHAHRSTVLYRGILGVGVLLPRPPREPHSWRRGLARQWVVLSTGLTTLQSKIISIFAELKVMKPRRSGDFPKRWPRRFPKGGGDFQGQRKILS